MKQDARAEVLMISQKDQYGASRHIIKLTITSSWCDLKKVKNYKNHF